jgi:hypothetical protein
MRAVLLELGRRTVGFCIWSHFPVELRHSTTGPRRADVTAAEAQREKTAQEEGGAPRGRRQPRGVQMTTTMDPGATLSRPKEVFRCG